MKNIVNITLLLLISLPLVGCGRPAITLRVLDAQTKEPLEGAAAIAWWTVSKGLPGLTYHQTAKVVEGTTGPDGKFEIPAVSYGQVPCIKVFKPGYVGWYNFQIYQGHAKDAIWLPLIIDRHDFKYITQDIYLERWKREFSFTSHFRFLRDLIPLDVDQNIQFKKIIHEYHLPLMQNEKR